MNKKTQNFIGEMISNLIVSKISVRLVNTPKVRVTKRISYNGWFTNEPPEFVMGAGKDFEEWFPIMLHEYCHFLQWRDEALVWTIMEEFENKNPDLDWEKWVEHKEEFPRRKINKLLRLARDVELDCEKRVIDLIFSNRLPIDTNKYIKRANSYIFFYNLAISNRIWYKGKAPYEVEEINETMPDYFLSNYNNTPKNYRKLVLQHCLNGDN